MSDQQPSAVTPGQAADWTADQQGRSNSSAGFAAIAALQPRPVTVKSLAAAFTSTQILVDVDQAERSGTGDGMWLVTPARPYDLAVQLLSSIDRRLTDDKPQSAPDLAKVLDDFTRTVINVSGRPALTAMARDVRKNHGMEAL